MFTTLGEWIGDQKTDILLAQNKFDLTYSKLKIFVEMFYKFHSRLIHIKSNSHL